MEAGMIEGELERAVSRNESKGDSSEGGGNGRAWWAEEGHRKRFATS